MTDEFDPLAGESGLLEDFDGTVVDSYFAIGQGNSADRTFLFLKCTTDNPDTTETDLRFGVGPDWASFDGGETVEHPQNKRTFNNQTAIIELFQTALTCGAEDVLRERLKADPEAHKSAAFWKGLAFHWNVKSETKKMKDRDSGQMQDVVINRTLPTKFLGVVEGESGGGATAVTPSGSGQAAAPTATSSETATETPGTAGNAAEGVDSLPADLTAQIRLLAQNNDFSSFVDEVMGLTDQNNAPIIKVPGVMKALSDEAWYNQLKAG